MNRRRTLLVIGRIAVGLLVPTALYYLVRALGASVYIALVVSTLVSAAPSLWALLHGRRANALSLYFTVMVLGSLVVTAIPGGTRFLLAREAILTAVTGLWFAVSAGAARPLAYTFSRPLLEGRLHWPAQWEQLWAVSPGFRRMWRISSVMYGVGLLIDAGLRVLLAYTRPPDTVPALGLVLSVGTVVVLNVVVHGYYVLCRVHDPRSPLRRAASAALARAEFSGEVPQDLAPLDERHRR
jgi:hypothetical protein